MGTTIKVYVVQQVLENGTTSPDILAVKLTRGLAQLIAKQYAPARVKALVADKTDDVNGETPDAAAEAAEGNENGLGRYFEDGHARLRV